MADAVLSPYILFTVGLARLSKHTDQVRYMYLYVCIHRGKGEEERAVYFMLDN